MALSDALPLYPLYALLFADTGLTDVEIAALLMLWSAVGIAAEVPTGALADRFSRRAALVASGVLTAGGFLVWILFPGFLGFAAGFVVWGVGGTLASGAFEALLYDGLASVGAADRYVTVIGRTEAAALAVQVPVAFAATGLFAVGGYPLVGWVSIGCSLAAAAVAMLLPDVRPLVGDAGPGDAGADADEPSYLATLRSGVAEAIGTPQVRGAVLAVSVLYGLESLEEFFPLLAADWGVPVGVVPLALIAVALVGAVGSWLAGWGSRLGAAVLGTGLAAAALLLGVAVLGQHPAGIVAITLYYGLVRLVLVVADARLQAAISGPARATVTSVSSLGAELAAIAMFGVWALGGPVVLAGIALLVAVVLPRWLRSRVTSTRH